MNAELEQIWSHMRSELMAAVDEPTFRVWLEPLRPTELTTERLSVEAPPRACDWIGRRFGRLLETCAASALGHPVKVVIHAGEQTPRPSAGDSAQGARPRASSRPLDRERGRRKGAPGAPGRPAEGHPPTHEQLAPRPHPEPLGNPRFTFEQFVIGDSNRLAHAAALTVAELPAQAYNPLFICGPPGVGKTHLLRAIASMLTSYNASLVLLATTGEAFTNEFQMALGGGEMEGFKNRFRHVDVLLVDDVQFLERKARTEEEFFHTFNALYESGAQIVLTSDRPPRDLQALEDRLRERFEAGLVADVRPPDMTTRLAILTKRAQQDGIQLEDQRTLKRIAERITVNVRSLEGALIRTVAFSSLAGRPLTPELADEVLDNLYPASKRLTSSIPEIQSAACEHFGLTTEELLSSRRSTRIAWPRQVAMYLARELTEESLPAIGRCFGGRDHTTVLHAWKRTAQRIADDDSSRIAVDKIRELLQRSHA